MLCVALYRWVAKVAGVLFTTRKNKVTRRVSCTEQLPTKTEIGSLAFGQYFSNVDQVLIGQNQLYKHKQHTMETLHPIFLSGSIYCHV